MATMKRRDFLRRTGAGLALLFGGSGIALSAQPVKHQSAPINAAAPQEARGPPIVTTCRACEIRRIGRGDVVNYRTSDGIWAAARVVNVEQEGLTCTVEHS
jgi:anaerobic selenocysteine-containing dehydrogenase